MFQEYGKTFNPRPKKVDIFDEMSDFTNISTKDDLEGLILIGALTSQKYLLHVHQRNFL